MRAHITTTLNMYKMKTEVVVRDILIASIPKLVLQYFMEIVGMVYNCAILATNYCYTKDLSKRHIFYIGAYFLAMAYNQARYS